MTDDEKNTGGASKDGRRAALANEPTSVNPFPEGGDAHEAWLDGWKEAKAAEGNTAPDDT